MKKTLIALALISVLTTACVPAVLVSAGTAAGAALGRDSRSLQTISDDTDIQFQAEQKIKSNPLTANGTNITVTSFNYVVLLTGQVPSEAVRAAAEADVQKVPKVRRVYNMLQVAPQIGIIQLGDDARISTNIRARMMVTSNLNSDNFKFVVVNKVVYLMGLASHEQTNLALTVIRNSSGVSRVINLVEYTDAKTDNTTQAAAVVTTNSTDSSTAPKATDATVTTPAPPAATPTTTSNTTTTATTNQSI